MSGRSNIRALLARKKRFRRAARVWRPLRQRLDLDLRRHEPLPLVIGGVQRGVVRSWLVGTVPAVRTLRRLLDALGIDRLPYSGFFSERGGTVECVCEPGCGQRWSSQRYLLNRAERQRERLGQPRMRRREDGAVEWTCARCIRGKIGSENFLRINRPGRIRGLDKQPRRRDPKTPEWKDAIGRAHVRNASLAKPFYLCPLCDLASYAHEWHQPCWLTWRWYCHRNGLDPSSERPPRLRQRGPDPARRLKRNYDLLMERSFRILERDGDRRRPTRVEMLVDPAFLADKPWLGSSVRPGGRRGPRRRLRSPSTVTKAIRAFLRAAPGGWNQIFTKSDSGNAARQGALPLPESLQPLIVAGKRDALVRRLHAFGMRREYIARLTGAGIDRVTHVIGDAEARSSSIAGAPEISGQSRAM